MLNPFFFRHKFSRLLHSFQPLQEICDQQWILCPKEKRRTRSAIFLDGELDKITGVSEFTTLNHELRRVKGAEDFEFSSSVAYEFSDVHICEGWLYKVVSNHSYKYSLVWGKESVLSPGDVFEMNEAAVASTAYGDRFFGHWMRDDLPLILEARKLSFPVSSFRHFTEHQIGYSELFGAHTYPVRKARFKKLFLLEEGQAAPNRYRRQRFDELRSKLRENASFGQPNDPPLGVMFLRKDSGISRILVNEKEIAEYLRKIGFRIIDPTNTSVEEIVRQSLDAKIVVSVDGSQQNHGIYTIQDRGAIFALQPPFRFNNLAKDFSDCMDMYYAFAVGTPVENGFHISVETIEKTLDLIQKRIDNN